MRVYSRIILFLLCFTCCIMGDLCAVTRLPTDKKVKVSDPLEKKIRDLLIFKWEKEAKDANRGRNISVTIQQVDIGEPRKWSLHDAFMGPSSRNPIYPVRAVFTTWIDCKTHIKTIKRDRRFECFENQMGHWQCNPLKEGNAPDEICDLEAVPSTPR